MIGTHRRWLAAIGTAAALAVLAVTPHLSVAPSAFLMDTHALILDSWNHLMQGLERAFTVNVGGGFRPLTSLSVFGTSWLFEGDTVAHRVVNFAVHGAGAVVTWRVALRLGLGRGAALVGALLFAWSPTLGFQVPWIAGRPDQLAAVSAGLVFLAYCRDRERPTWGRLAVLYAAVLLLAMSKEVGLLVPIVLVALGTRHRRRYAPLLLVTIGLVAIRAHFHATYYGADIQAQYDPLRPFTDLEHLATVVAGTGRQLFSLLTGSVGSWQLTGTWTALPAAAVGFGLGGLVLWTTLRSTAAFAVALVLPTVPFLFRDYGYYLNAAAVFLVPGMVLLVMTSMQRTMGRAVLGVMLLASLVSSLHHALVWRRAAERFRTAVVKVDPHRRQAEELLYAEKRPVALEVHGLPLKHGPLYLFPPNLTPYALNSVYFPFYRTRDPGDFAYQKWQMLQFFAGAIPAAMRAYGEANDWVIRTIRVE